MTPDVFTLDYVGEPGRRAFYLQSRGGAGTHSFLVEKQQAAVLAEKLRDLLLLVDNEDTIRSSPPERDPALALVEPVEPEFRVGTMGLAYEEDADRVVIFMQSVEAAEDEEDPLAEDEPSGMRLLLRRDQARAFVLHTVAVVAEGRPLCQLCGLPMDPEGHICPASNGHRLSN